MPARREGGGLTAPKILFDEERTPAAPFRDPELGWSTLAGVGLAFLVLGCLDIGPLFWLPLALGVQHWDGGKVGQAYTAGLPLVTLGLALPLAAGIAIGRRRWVLLTSSVLLSLGTLLIMAPLVYGAGLLRAWYSGSDPLKVFGLKSMVTDGLWPAITYPLLFLWAGLKGLRSAHANR